jgi:predicted transposase YbfD/YdcC
MVSTWGCERGIDRHRLVAGDPPLARSGRYRQGARIRETAGKTTTETAYFLLSTMFTPERLNEVVRSHWAPKIGCTRGWMT